MTWCCSPVAARGVRRSGSCAVWRIADASGCGGDRVVDAEEARMEAGWGKRGGRGASCRTRGEGRTLNIESCLRVGRECIEREGFLEEGHFTSIIAREITHN